MIDPRDRGALALLLTLDGQREAERHYLRAPDRIRIRARVLAALLMDRGALATKAIHRIVGEEISVIQVALAHLAERRLVDSFHVREEDEVAWFVTTIARNGVEPGDLERVVSRAVDLAIGCEERTYSGAPS